MAPELFAVVWCIAAWVAVVGLLVAISVSDLRVRRVPNVWVVALVVVWAALHAGLLVCGVPAEELPAAANACGAPEALSSLMRPAGAVIGLITSVVAVVALETVSMLYERIRGKVAMGAGDVKLIGALALFAGPVRSIVGLIVACSLALLFSVLGRRRTFPFAPMLALGFVCAMSVEL